MVFTGAKCEEEIHLRGNSCVVSTLPRITRTLAEPDALCDFCGFKDVGLTASLRLFPVC